jgi:ABC-type branched-subunit amino acid transport system ATPase component/sugar phosphate permease
VPTTDSPFGTSSQSGRELLGVTGLSDAPPLREVLRVNQLGYYPVLALGVLAIIDQFQGYAFTVLTPDIGATLGLGIGTVAALRVAQTFAQAISPLPIAAIVRNRASRAALCIGTGVIWSVVTLFTGFVPGLLALLAVLVVDGLSTGSVGALHYPLLTDIYPPAGRVRVFSFYNALGAFGSILSPLLVALLSVFFLLTWRGVFVALGLIAVLGSLSTLRLRDPGFGKWDTEAIRAAVIHNGSAVRPDSIEHKDVDLGFFEIAQRLMLIPTLRRMYSGYMVLGMLLVPFATFLSYFLADRWNMDASERGFFFAGIAAASVVGLLLFAKRGERVFRLGPQRMTRFASYALALAVLLLALGAAVPSFIPMVVCFAVGETLIAILAPCINIVMLSIVRARHRPIASALAGIAVAVGAIAGTILLSGIDSRFGLAGAIGSLVVPGVVGALILGSAGRLVEGDLDRMISEVQEEETVKQSVTAGHHVPLLACRGIDFSYGKLQVLFDVGLTVDEGEMVALLGVNGAGKSTLLNVISGLALPQSGTVRLSGHDITYLDAERRLKLGVAQVPGGRAVFPPLTVIDNLRVFGHTLGRDRTRVNEAIERALAAFPRLEERRNQHAVTLSGGEQQMLALSKSLILAPKLLLIDELSLGLAPVVVAQLVDMVRTINASGTAIVLVEQSVNVAFSLVERCYFMERGQVRFEGSPVDLVERDDLLRAVFLGNGAPL